MNSVDVILILIIIILITRINIKYETFVSGNDSVYLSVNIKSKNKAVFI